jgi:sugar O-acyltransferase (sialic acid O-acetyltransferase NeuD family)
MTLLSPCHGTAPETTPNLLTVRGVEVAGQDMAEVRRWLIVGAGGFGREVLSWTSGLLSTAQSSTPVGFLDDDPTSLDPFPDLKELWVGRTSTYSPQSGDRLLMAVGDPSSKLAVGEALKSRGAVFGSFVHPTAVIAHDVRIGVGCIICPFAVVCCNVRLGNFVSMNIGSVAGHDSIIGDGCTLSPHSDVAGNVNLQRGVFLGCQTAVLPKTQIGEFARIGAGSVVINHVSSGVSMMGVPAKRIGWMKHESDVDQPDSMAG